LESDVSDDNIGHCFTSSRYHLWYWSNLF